MFKEVNDAFNWMVSFTNLEKKPDLSKRGYRLDKMEKLLTLFNNPQTEYKILHVAGSKGKGSTCGFLGSILTEAGYKTGIYSSPHLLDYRERITDNHNFFSINSYLKAINHIKKTLDNIDFTEFPGGEPTTFELMTLTAFIIFKNEECEWVILETGIGGRLDSTNAVIPEASLITPIELEHTELLGNTLQEIALEKAGIIKINRPVFTSDSNSAVVKVLNKIAKERSSPIFVTPQNYTCKVTDQGTTLNYMKNSYKLGLEGNIQAQNALLAMVTINKLLPDISNKIISKGLEKTSIPGRFQKFEKEIVIVVDGAHTRNSVKTAIDTFINLYGNGTLIFGAVTGKDITSMAEVIKEKFSKVIISTPGTFKESDLGLIEQIFINNGIESTTEKSPEKALSIAKKYNRPILVTGSFYMAGEIARLLSDYE